MAAVIAGIGTSHVPAVGAAIDGGKQAEPYWAPYFAKIEPARSWMAEARPDVCVVVYNDHALRLPHWSWCRHSLWAWPPGSRPPMRATGPARCPKFQGIPELAWHLAESLILNEFDIAIANEMPVDHGCTVPLSVLYGQPETWPCRVVPLCVNVIQYPPPTGHRCWQLGKALRRAIEAYPGDERVAVLGTGGMSHQLQGERAGLVNLDFDRGVH